MDIPIILFTASAFVLAGFVKGVVGLGLPAIAMGLLAVVMSPAQAAALLVVPSLVTNLGQMLDGGPLRPLVHRLRGMMLGIVAGTAVGAMVLPAATGKWATGVLGLTLVANAALNLLKVDLRVPGKHESLLAALTGVTTGMLTVATGVFVIPAVPYLRALMLPRDEFVRALGLSFTVSSVTLALALTVQGAFRTEIALTSVLVLLPALAGLQLGALLRRWVGGEAFKTVFDTSLLLLGLFQVWQALA